VRRFKSGDEVYARPDDFRIGTFVEFVPVKEALLALKPKGLTMEQAAAGVAISRRGPASVRSLPDDLRCLSSTGPRLRIALDLNRHWPKQ
jgi:hypothetical protein